MLAEFQRLGSGFQRQLAHQANFHQD
jgi:hypothetical protein